MHLHNMSSLLFIIFIAILEVRVGGKKALSHEFIVHLFTIKVPSLFPYLSFHILTFKRTKTEKS